MLNVCFTACFLLLFTLAFLNAISNQQIQGQQQDLKKPCPPEDRSRQFSTHIKVLHNKIWGLGPNMWGGDSLVVQGGSSQWTIMGGRGQDCLVGNDGPNLLLAEDGPDTLYGGKGIDTLDGGRDVSKDTFICGPDADVLKNAARGVDNLDNCPNGKISR